MLGLSVNEVFSLTASDGHKFNAYLSHPAGTPIGGLLVVQEAFGVNHHVRMVADAFANDGFLAVAPALYDRIEPGVELGYTAPEIQRGISLARQLKPEEAVTDMAAVLQYLGEHASNKCGVIGYCFGGTMAWLAATRLRPSAAVGYYGGNITRFAEEKPQCPVMLHFGKLDQHIPKEGIDQLQAAHPDVQVFWYDADHAFNCDERPSFNPAAAALARERSLAFLRRHVAGV